MDNSMATKLAEQMFNSFVYGNKITIFSRELLNEVLKSAYNFLDANTLSKISDVNILSNIYYDNSRCCLDKYFGIFESNDNITIFAYYIGDPIVFNISCDISEGFSLKVMSNINRKMVTIYNRCSFIDACQTIFDILVGKFPLDGIRTNQNRSLLNIIDNIQYLCNISTDIYNIRENNDHCMCIIDNALEFKNGFVVILENSIWDIGDGSDDLAIEYGMHNESCCCAEGEFNAHVYLRKDIVEKLAQNIILDLSSFSYYNEFIHVRNMPGSMLIKNTMASKSYNNQIYYSIEKLFHRPFPDCRVGESLLYNDLEQLSGQQFGCHRHKGMSLLDACKLINTIASWDSISACTRLVNMANDICRKNMSNLERSSKDYIIHWYGSIENALLDSISL